MNIPFSMFRCGVLVCALLPCVPSLAQDKDGQRVVTVEREYNPDVDNASKVDVLPEHQLPAVQRKPIEYGTSAQAYRGSRYQLGPDIIQQTQGRSTRGYVQGGGGNYGQMDFKAGYLFDITPNDELNAAFSFGGTNHSFDTRYVPEYGGNTPKWSSHYYRTDVNLGYSHSFEEVTLGIGANLGIDNFSYYRFLSAQGGTTPNWYEYLKQGGTANQGHRKFDVQANIRSNEINTLPIQFDISTGYFSFRRSHMADWDGKALTENLIHTVVDGYGDLSMDQSLGLKLEMDNLFYSDRYSSYTSLEANPYYNLYYNGFKLHLGGKVNYNVGRDEAVQFAPDLTAEYPFYDGYSIYGELKGGHILNDFRRLEMGNPYWMSGRLKDSHERMNAMLGVKGSVGRIFAFDLNAGYNITADDICYMNLFSEITDIAYLYAVNQKTKHFFASGELNFRFPDIANFKVGAKFYDWDADHSMFLLMKPKDEVNLALDFSITKDLKVNVGYTFMEYNRANIEYYRVSQSNALMMDLNSLNPDLLRNNALGDPRTASVRMKPISNLSAGVTLDVFDNFSIYAQVNNLLDRDYDYYYSYSAQGLNFFGGLSYRF